MKRVGNQEHGGEKENPGSDTEQPHTGVIPITLLGEVTL